MLRDAAPQDRLEIGDVGNVDDLVDAVDEGASWRRSSRMMAEEDDEMLPPQRARAPHQLAQDRIFFETGAFKIFVDRQSRRSCRSRA